MGGLLHVSINLLRVVAADSGSMHAYLGSMLIDNNYNEELA